MNDEGNEWKRGSGLGGFRGLIGFCGRSVLSLSSKAIPAYRIPGSRHLPSLMPMASGSGRPDLLPFRGDDVFEDEAEIAPRWLPLRRDLQYMSPWR